MQHHWLTCTKLHKTCMFQCQYMILCKHLLPYYGSILSNCSTTLYLAAMFTLSSHLIVRLKSPSEKWRDCIKRRWGASIKRCKLPSTKRGNHWLQHSYMACADKQCHVLPEAIVQKCDASWCGNKTVLTSATKQRWPFHAKPITHSSGF